MVFGWLEEKALGRTGLDGEPTLSVSGDARCQMPEAVLRILTDMKIGEKW